MPKLQKPVTDVILVPFWLAVGGAVGGIALELLSANSAGHEPDLKKLLVTTIAGTLAGAGLGVLFEILRKWHEASERLDGQIDKLSRIEATLNAQLAPLFSFSGDRLLSAGDYNPVFWALAKDSLHGSRWIANVDPFRYLSYLNRAILASDQYHGIQRRPVRWFRDTPGAQEYLHQLKSKPMSVKVRIFVVDENSAGDMENDLKDKEVMELYWQRTGSDVETWWVDTKALGEANLAVVDDCALYDNNLIIQYNQYRQTLYFDLRDGTADEEIHRASRIFDKLDEQKRLTPSSNAPFKRIRPPLKKDEAAE